MFQKHVILFPISTHPQPKKPHLPVAQVGQGALWLLVFSLEASWQQSWVVQILWCHRGGQVALGGWALTGVSQGWGWGTGGSLTPCSSPDPSIQELWRACLFTCLLRGSSPLLSKCRFTSLRTCRIWKGGERVGYYGILFLFASGEWASTGTKNQPVCWQSEFPVLEGRIMQWKEFWPGHWAGLAQWHELPFTSLLFCFLNLSQEARMRCSLRHLVASVSTRCIHITPRVGTLGFLRRLTGCSFFRKLSPHTPGCCWWLYLSGP